MEEMCEIACNTIDQQSEELKALSMSIWNMPELGFNEFHAHSVLTEYLLTAGFHVEKSFKLETAFRATYKPENTTNGPNIAVLCEYDALPGIGHACGHNLIAEVGIATAVGVKAAMIANMDTKTFGTLTVIGCPAEEGLCGKADLIRLGAFDGIDVAMMAHPSQTTLARPNYVSMTPLSITFYGKASHASSYPWEGLNALDAAVTCYTNISHLRQQMKPTWRVHGVIKNGGAQPNIIPEETQLEYYLRTPNNLDMMILKKKVEDCVNAAALSTGCKVNFSFGEKSYSNLISNNTMAEVFMKQAESIGVQFETDEEKKRKFGGSTDMGNVSHVVPSIHPKFYIGTNVSNHSKDFTVAAGDDRAQKYTLDIAKGLALTILQLYNDDKLLEQVKEDFKKDVEASCVM